MNIDSHSIIIFSHELDPLEKSLESYNYVVLLEGLYFQYTDKDNFTIETLKSLFSDPNPKIKDVKGTIESSSYEIAKKTIRDALCFESDLPVYGPPATKNVLKLREATYWSIVQKYFPYNPETVFFHIAENNSYFGGGVMWEFTFIFLHKGNGIVLSGQAWD